MAINGDIRTATVIPGVVLNAEGQFERVFGWREQRPPDEVIAGAAYKAQQVKADVDRLALQVQNIENMITRINRWVKLPAEESSEEKRARVEKAIQKIWAEQRRRETKQQKTGVRAKSKAKKPSKRKRSA